MVQAKIRTILVALFCITFLQTTFAQKKTETNDQEVLESGIEILRTYFLQDKNWHVTDADVRTNIRSLINFFEDIPLDTALYFLHQKQLADTFYVYRLPENVEDSLSVPGYVPAEEIKRNVEQIGIDLQSEVQQNPIPVPEQVIENAKLEAPLVPPDKGMVLFADGSYVFPDTLIIPEVIPDSILNSPEEFQRLVKIDSLRSAYVEQKRLEYNDSVTTETVNRVAQEYRQNMFEQQLRFKTNRYRDSVTLNNYRVLRIYNDRVMDEVNDTLKVVIDLLTSYADYIDTTTVNVLNMNGDPVTVTMQNGNTHFAKMWLKNAQNDSLQLVLKSMDKKSVQLLVSDGVTFNRFSERQTKDFDFESLKENKSGFSKMKNPYAVETPWILNGEGSVGFTQTYYENWKKGGESAISLLLNLKGSANYSSADAKIKWENSAEIRNGWLQPGGKGSELKKNDDKVEVTSRFGLRAHKKWYYSGEFNFNTQFFRGYKYPKADHPDPISAFMSPAKTYFKLGMDYKPNSDFSLFLSPITVKNVFVKDTALIDQTKFGVEAGRRAFWEPGLNAEFKYKTNLTQDITWETKYKMFVNYRDPFKKLDIDWENNLRVQLTDYISMRMMLHMVYDDDVLFPVYDDDDNKIGEKAKLQIKEFITVGFNYTINRKVTRTKRVR
ncbi:DUF3078 domain-containing protein [Maribellus mangrovi]|uniref:DUF3078 domain-containing protein n=1 Tax=Maribellus mangrovi TaxID=3133146 RepID=UPI0030ECFC43